MNQMHPYQNLNRNLRLFYLLCYLLLPLSLYAQDKNRSVVMVFAKNGVDEGIRVKMERDLRELFDSEHEKNKAIPRTLPIELFYDVGYLSTSNLEKSKMHFNEAQRALEKNDLQEASEQLFRAERFYNKGVPYVRDEALLQTIFYYQYLLKKASKKEKDALDLYCTYISLSRNLTGSVGPIEQYETLGELCGNTPMSGTGELEVSSNTDGAHVFINNRSVGIVSKNTPHLVPYMPAGVHLVEVRKAGFVRDGKLITLKNSGSEKFKANLKTAKNVDQDYQPLYDLPYKGADAYSDTYMNDFFFEYAEKLRTQVLMLVYVDLLPSQELEIVVLCFKDQQLSRNEIKLPLDQVDAGAKSALTKIWVSIFNQQVDPNAPPAQVSWMPTLFKVE